MNGDSDIRPTRLVPGTPEPAAPGRRLVLGAGLASILALGLDHAPAQAHSRPLDLDGAPAQAPFGPAVTAPARARSRPLALVYRGPASEAGASAAAVAAIRRSGAARAVYVGPSQPLRLTATALRGAALYVQPGGGSVEAAWPHMAPYRRLLVDWVHGGGHYLGVCLGGYLAADGPGFGLWPGRIVDYKSVSGADIRRGAERLASIRWRGRWRVMYVEDPPTFALARGARRVTVLARYRTRHIAAASVPVGRGRVTVVGPHPDAPAAWTSGVGGPSRWDAGPWIDLERTALAR